MLITDTHNTASFAVSLAPGMTATQRRLTPYGVPRGAAPENWPGTRGFVGGTLDATGLTHLGAREYDPALGRFLSVDPVIDMMDPLQMQGYNYGYNNPLAFMDADGRWGWSDVTHATLDVVGMVPVVGEGADLVNAGIYAYEGDWTNAALSAASAIPVAGNVATGAKMAKNASKAMDAGTAVAKKSDDAVDLSKKAPPTKEAPKKKEEKNQRKKDKDDDEEYVDLYHGTTAKNAMSILENGVNPKVSPRAMDFGVGFYTTNDLDQAKKWAKNLSGRAKRDGATDAEAAPVVLHYRVPKSEFARLNGRVFKSADKSWEKFVETHRRKDYAKNHHKYDYVEGPMLGNSKVWPAKKSQGVKPTSFGHQISFHMSWAASFFAMFFSGLIWL
ncbi:DUF3990 domain-containing protein [Streptomyces flaveolus]|uniref:DUF3990 domain-containing protein n=1 Tax=Streptomyces flaveolus TaxID=67297 RepID=UPI00381935BF